MENRATLLRPPPPDPNKAPIENVLEVTELAVLGPNIFTNARKPWHPPGARGIYGGAVIAMCLAAAQRTVADDFLPHSCHCYFLLAGASNLPILFHVEQVRDGRSFATRTVQARQRGRCIFTTTISFVKDGSSGPSGTQVSHSSAMPIDPATKLPVQPPPDDWDGEPPSMAQGPFQGTQIQIISPNGTSTDPRDKKTRQWLRSRGKITGGTAAQLEALAYISDSYFIGTVTRLHNLWRFPNFRPEDFEKLKPEMQDRVRTLHQWEGMGDDPRDMAGRPTLGMMVSLDHTIYFHEPKRVKADEWMMNEMDSPWAGDGRGVVMQKIFAKDGTLLATCVQEGLVRLQPPETESKESKL
ncbi:putative acyl-coenzyme A thioesterase [Cercophora samala]|uniref:Acyl-coenzyme A thioesterase n=1 Tax=Cercophora samala TaxID=330535 RepID=A0AA40DF02_9PEZI|nr:putative acyl-coenzyme A thioesterase [Cercophora samala]